ncbi:MAG: hypothetical protein K0S04_2251 [Herbinix sp.]|jgi:hypothetical protein|nr:hypothetical protein [Herbinix sp.]
MKNMIFLRPANKDDLNVIEDWLNKEYIKKWYGDPRYCSTIMSANSFT